MKKETIIRPLIAVSLAALFSGCIHKTHDTLHEAVRYGNEKLAEYYVMRKGMDPNSIDNSGMTPLEYAVRYSDEDMAEMLIEQGADVNRLDARGRTALMAAAAYGKTDAAELLLDYKADPNIVRNDGMTALMFARQYGHTEIEEMLVESGAKTTWDLNTSLNARLLLAAETGDLPEAGRLLAEGADVNARYYNTRSTPLIEAVLADQVPMITLLLNAGADANLSDAENKTARQYAEASGDSILLKLFTPVNTAK